MISRTQVSLTNQNIIITYYRQQLTCYITSYSKIIKEINNNPSQLTV